MRQPWSTTFHLTVSPLELFLRGSIIYLVLFVVLLKFKRPAGGLGVSDLLLLVLMADAAQNAMSAEYKSVFDGLILLGTLLFWNIFIDWLSIRWRWLGHQMHGEPQMVVRNGELLQPTLRRAWLTPEELSEHLREHGIEDVRDVKAAYLETNGKITVIPVRKAGDGGKEEDDPVAV
jgi:uncharacterized membrane protein YcaP (DUF421 family)